MKSPLVLFLEELIKDARLVDKQHGIRCYDISLNGSKYITRFFQPKIGARRVMLHNIIRPDADRFMHNHPWKECHSAILHGGYIEKRMVRDSVNQWWTKYNRYWQGSTNSLLSTDYHMVTHVEPDTWTLFMTNERLPEGWGYWNEETNAHQKYVSSNTNEEEA